MMALVAGHWLPILDGDARALGLVRRHYSWREYADGRPHRLFVGPGEKMVLLTQDCRAVFAWRKFKDDSGQVGVNNCVFRNESAIRSSDLIREADDLAWQRWPGERFYTYIDPKKVRSTNPGYCYIMAGWRKCGATKSGLLIFEILP